MDQFELYMVSPFMYPVIDQFESYIVSPFIYPVLDQFEPKIVDMFFSLYYTVFVAFDHNCHTINQAIVFKF